MTNMPDMSPSPPRRRTCIIGAGISGLVAARVFLGRGRDIFVAEAGHDIGGVWAPSKSYPGVRTQTPRDLYSFSDAPMPAAYPEWPEGGQIYQYLCDYAARFGLLSHIHFNTSIQTIARAPGGWSVTLSGPDGSRTETFDEVVICSGQFSRPKRLDLPGQDAFTAAGGVILHSSAHRQAAAAAGRDVVVLGFSKSATDVAMQALEAGARSVTMVYREPAWKIPYFFGNLINFKNILYCRASEAMFMPWAPSRLGRLARILSAPMIWANWRALEALLGMQFKLKRLGLRPARRIEDTIHCATSIETPGFYAAIARGAIKMVRGTLQSYAPGAAIASTGETLPADLVVLAIGWQQDLPFLDAATRAALIEPDGQYRLHRMIVNPDLPGLGFVGFNSSFATTLSAELSAHWLAAWFDGTLAHTPSPAAMRTEIARVLAWKRKTRPAASQFGGLCIAPYHFAHFDELMHDMGVRPTTKNPIAATLLPIDPKAYAVLWSKLPTTQKENAL